VNIMMPKGEARRRIGLAVVLVGCVTSFYLVGLLLLPIGFVLLRPPRA